MIKRIGGWKITFVLAFALASGGCAFVASQTTGLTQGVWLFNAACNGLTTGLWLSMCIQAWVWNE